MYVYGVKCLGEAGRNQGAVFRLASDGYILCELHGPVRGCGRLVQVDTASVYISGYSNISTDWINTGVARAECLF